MNFLKRYFHWLHGQWPAGQVEKAPELDDHGQTNMPGVMVVGDLKGIPLLKFSVDSGTKAITSIVNDPSFKPSHDPDLIDIAILGAGVSGISAALEAQRRGLRIKLIEGTEPFSTLINFPKGKPIYTYPKDMIPEGTLTLEATTKEQLIEELQGQIQGKITVTRAVAQFIRRVGSVLEVHLQHQPPLRAQRVIVALGKSGHANTLNVPGEQLDKVFNRLHDPKDFAGKQCLVVGGGDSACETALALAQAGAAVTLSYRQPQLSRAKPDNVEALHAWAQKPLIPSQAQDVRHPSGPGSIELVMSSTVKTITPSTVDLTLSDGRIKTISNDLVFTMIGRQPPFDFFRRSGLNLVGEWTWKKWGSLALMLGLCTFVYHWKKTGLQGFSDIPVLGLIVTIGDWFSSHRYFPYNIADWGSTYNTPFLNTVRISLSEPGFYYSLIYSVAVVCFGIKRIARARTPYVTWQTWTLALIQLVPLFLLPYFVLPWLGARGVFDHGCLKTVADHLFPIANYGHGREYWRAFGLILAWPLFFWNVFTHNPLWTWLVISLVQTGILIPILVYFWGKGAYCGWICSCGALAETLGDRHRHKMPHGPFWNKLNWAGQIILLWVFILLFLRILSWNHVAWATRVFNSIFNMMPIMNYVWFVDVLLAGIVGVGLYFHFSGRVWCRFFCPLAALMNIYARFSRFRILSDKKKCISCNVCTSVCHQGIDIMSVANKGIPMSDPQCVRCSACVQQCPTGCLTFGQVNSSGAVIKFDEWPANQLHLQK